MYLAYIHLFNKKSYKTEEKSSVLLSGHPTYRVPWLLKNSFSDDLSVQEVTRELYLECYYGTVTEPHYSKVDDWKTLDELREELGIQDDPQDEPQDDPGD